MKRQKTQLRNEMKAKRLMLSPTQQSLASQSIIQPALDLVEQYQASHLAFFLPFNGEISPLPLIKTLLKQGKSIYLPVLHPFTSGQLLFIRYHSHTALKPHSFGMSEPKLDVRFVKPVTELEMIFTPLLACDNNLARLGYGGGYYDRTFANAPKAIRVGIAHQCQLVEKVPTEPWDIPLHHLILG